LEGELASRYRDRSRVRLHREPGMPHHLAEPPGVEPARQQAVGLQACVSTDQEVRDHALPGATRFR